MAHPWPIRTGDELTKEKYLPSLSPAVGSAGGSVVTDVEAGVLVSVVVMLSFSVVVSIPSVVPVVSISGDVAAVRFVVELSEGVEVTVFEYLQFN